MLMGHTEGLSDLGSSKDHLISDPEPDLDDYDDEFNAEQILYTASFEELGKNTLKYDTVIWVSISLLLVLAWGVGILMLLYLPVRRYVLQKEISSRKLYVTPNEIVYKVSRPSFIPFWGVAAIEQRVPLSLVIDVIIEQGCLQSVYGIHTFRVESIARGKAAPVDELQVQGVVNPATLRKVIITEAAKNIQDAGKGWKAVAPTGEGESMSRMASLSEGPTLFKSPSKSWKMTGSPRYASMEPRSPIIGDVVLNKIEEVSRSVKRIESLIERSQNAPESSQN
ncbi:hypothetical protein JCGZ_14440 [Jatropha curcas]|uniref:DUF7642 domain-containing protein n=1 Tax=Jatropha curcas TaxID=180498 RepID=A0A067KA34_JATCU|nr:uncharacterized protein LOC105643027 [Jatropha curcas]XP_012083451.1 uncharacterized protein LOC105643027 [Jatropha curcas]KDP28669.1 hypothetical protein JCGZ_14440 [Jatropha curcas]